MVKDKQAFFNLSNLGKGMLDQMLFSLQGSMKISSIYIYYIHPELRICHYHCPDGEGSREGALKGAPRKYQGAVTEQEGVRESIEGVP